MKNIIKITLLFILLPNFAFASAEDMALQKLIKTKSIEELSAQNTNYNTSVDFPPNVNIAAWAKAKGNGSISVGDLLIDIREDETSYRIEAHLLTSGLVKRITKFKSYSVTTGIKKNGRYIPKTFDTTRRLRDKTTNVKIEYDEDGKVITNIVNPPDKAWKRAIVKENIRDYTVDPLTMILVARQHAYNASNGEKKKKFTLPLYDARRRSNLLFALKNEENIDYNKKKIPTHHLIYKREIISGFTKNELKRMDDEEPIVDFYIDEKSYFLPIKARGAAPLGTANAEVKRFCVTLEECFKKYKD